MASTYPGAFDNLTNPAASDPLTNPAHAALHTDENDAIEAVQATLGLNPQGAFPTVAARMSQVDVAAGSAAASAGSAANSASIALNAADTANQYAGTAVAAAGTATAVWLAFDARYLGSKPSNPTVDNQGNPLTTGALYFNSTANIMYAYGATNVWQSIVAALPSTIVANSSTPALQVTQAGSGAALLVEDQSADTSPFIVTATGSVGIGTATPTHPLHVIGTAAVSALLVNGTAVQPLPPQTDAAGLYLTTNGTVASWGTASSLPSQTGQAGEYLRTNGTVASWEPVDALPSQSGNSGRYLTTNGSVASWQPINTDPFVGSFLLGGM